MPRAVPFCKVLAASLSLAASPAGGPAEPLAAIQADLTPRHHFAGKMEMYLRFTALGAAQVCVLHSSRKMRHMLES